ncbi:Hypothetical protein D9617_9g024410 [Elsinoe fawcettii]|nr:Hypothetical protein D9617_9g024410 [Elsinoe fawcettii]
MSGQSQATLPTLLALDKTYEGLEDRIQGAFRILGITLNEQPDGFPQASCSNYGRQDWTFRWILGHLRKDPNARSSELAWTLMGNLIRAVPGTVSAKWLASSGLAQLMSKTLEENGSASLLASARDRHVDSTRHSGVTVQPANGESSQASKKRKRGQDSTAVVSGPLLLQDPFVKVTRVLLDVLDGPTDSNRSILEASQTKLLAGMTEIEAARLLKWWTNSAIHHISQESQVNSSEALQLVNRGFTSLSKALRRRKHAFDANEWRSAIAKEVLWSLLVLWARIVELPQVEGRLNSAQPTRIIRSFIVEELLRPLRDMTTESKKASQSTAKVNGSTESASLDSLLNEAKAVLSVSHKQDLTKAQDLVSDTFRLLLEAATSLIDGQGFVQRRVQTQWVEYMFSKLSSVRSYVEQQGSNNATEICRPIVEALLRPYHGRKEFSRSAGVKAALSVYGGITPESDLGSEIKPDFGFIASVLAADPNTLDLANPADSFTVRSLFMAIDTEFSQMSLDEQAMCTDRILLPIVNSHQRSRVASSLVDIVVEISKRSQADVPSAWFTGIVRRSLLDLITTSVDISYLRQLLEDLNSTVKSFLDTGATEDISASGTLSALCILLRTLENQEQIDQLKSQFGGLLSDLNAIVDKSSTRKLIEKEGSFWVLLHLLNTHLAPNPGEASKSLLEIQEASREAAEGLIKKAAKGKISEGLVEAVLDYLFHCQQLEASATQVAETGTKTIELINPENVVQKYPSSVARSTVKHPLSWMFLDTVIRRLVLKHLLSEAPGHNRTYVRLWDMLCQGGDATGPESVLDDLLETASPHSDLVQELLLNHVFALHTDKTLNARIHRFLKERLPAVADAGSDDAEALRVLALLKKYAAGSKTLKKGMERIVAAHAASLLKTRLDALSGAGADRIALQDLLAIEGSLFEQEIDAPTHTAMVDRLSVIIAGWNGAERVAFVHIMLDGVDVSPRLNLLVALNTAIKQIQKIDLINEDLMSGARRIVVRMSGLLQQVDNMRTCHALMRPLTDCLKDKRFLINQYNIENILESVHRLSTSTSNVQGSTPSSTLYIELCSALQLILQSYRPSLGGRLHLVVPLLTQLLACLFVPINNRSSRSVFHHPLWIHPSRSLGPKHAARFTRLVTLLCNPPQSTISGYRSRSHKPGLVDELREARLHVSEFSGMILHGFCRFMLNGTLNDGVKDALNPALYAVFNVLDMAAPEDERVKALGASMTKAELALLRREHGEWKRFGRWKG